MSDGAVWVVLDQGAACLQGNAWTLYTVGSAGKVLKDADPELRVVSLPANPNVPDCSFYSAFEDRGGFLWLGLNTGAEGGALLRANYRAGRLDDPAAWTWLTRSGELDVARNPLVFQARDGVIWTVNGISRNRLMLIFQTAMNKLAATDDRLSGVPSRPDSSGRYLVSQ